MPFFDAEISGKFINAIIDGKVELIYDVGFLKVVAANEDEARLKAEEWLEEACDDLMIGFVEEA